MNLCQYKNSLGVPQKGIHKYRLGGLAVVDVFFTLLASFFLSYYFRISWITTSLLLFALGIVMHRLFCVRTTIDKILFY